MDTPTDTEREALAVLSRAWDLVRRAGRAFEYALLGASTVRWTEPGEKLDTLAVTIMPNNGIELIIDAAFVASLRAKGAALALIHEAEHLHRRHPHFTRILLARGDRQHAGDPQWTMVKEGSVNYVAQHAMQMPTFDLRVYDTNGDSRPIGVNPDKVWRSYKTAAEKAGATSILSIDDFYADELRAYALIKQYQAAGHNPQKNWCSHDEDEPAPPAPEQQPGTSTTEDQDDGEGAGTGDGDDDQTDDQDDGEGAGTGDGDDDQTDDQGVPVSQASTGQIMATVEAALEATAAQARAGNNDAKAQLQSMHAANPDSPIWGSVSVGDLVGGSKVKNREVAFWKRMAGEVAAMVRIDEKLRFSPRRAFHPIPFTRESPTPWPEIVMYFDFSGSMYPLFELMEGAITNRVPKATIRSYAFDTQVTEIFKGGGDVATIHGRGGTSLAPVVAHAAALADGLNPPDSILVISDCYVQQVEFPVPDKWVVGITSLRGDEFSPGQLWPEQLPPAKRPRTVRIKKGDLPT